MSSAAIASQKSARTTKDAVRRGQRKEGNRFSQEDTYKGRHSGHSCQSLESDAEDQIVEVDGYGLVLPPDIEEIVARPITDLGFRRSREKLLPLRQDTLGIGSCPNQLMTIHVVYPLPVLRGRFS